MEVKCLGIFILHCVKAYWPFYIGVQRMLVFIIVHLKSTQAIERIRHLHLSLHVIAEQFTTFQPLFRVDTYKKVYVVL